MFVLFFFQAEDGIRDVAVTGVQTCALPISAAARGGLARVSLRWTCDRGSLAGHEAAVDPRRGPASPDPEARVLADAAGLADADLEHHAGTQRVLEPAEADERCAARHRRKRRDLRLALPGTAVSAALH